MCNIPRHILFQCKGTFCAFHIVTYHVINLVPNLWKVMDGISGSIPVNHLERWPYCLHYLHRAKPLGSDGNSFIRSYHMAACIVMQCKWWVASDEI
jgi:hypothetical protein